MKNLVTQIEARLAARITRIKHMSSTELIPYAIVASVGIGVAVVARISLSVAEHRAPHMGAVCTASHWETNVILTYNPATKSSMPQYTRQEVCDSSVPHCFDGGAKYKGPLACVGGELRRTED